MLKDIDFEKGGGLVPVIVQDAENMNVLMLAYMNKDALDITRNTGRATFYSRSRNELWEKGETSGNWLEVEDVSVDCDGDTLLLKVRPNGPVCHTGDDTCFGNTSNSNLSFLKKLDELIASRKKDLPENSYTTSLFSSGLNKIAQKVGEEAVEFIIEAVDNNEDLFLNEGADLLYHMLVLLQHKGFSIADVISVLEKRHS
ncbi:MAG: bifunctional phosphoribosyl-AMP cyclohydrolase/phosphoribosyl-ATP diphosphatase HisIE [Bacteroidales bacterium]